MKYNVVIEEKRYYAAEVEADSIDEAKELAMEDFTQGDWGEGYDIIAARCSVYSVPKSWESEDVQCEKLGSSVNIAVQDIEWDTDGEEVDLPTDMNLDLAEVLGHMDEDAWQTLNEAICDTLSEKTGFCCGGYNW